MGTRQYCYYYWDSKIEIWKNLIALSFFQITDKHLAIYRCYLTFDFNKTCDVWKSLNLNCESFTNLWARVKKIDSMLKMGHIKLKWYKKLLIFKYKLLLIGALIKEERYMDTKYFFYFFLFRNHLKSGNLLDFL